MNYKPLFLILSLKLMHLRRDLIMKLMQSYVIFETKTDLSDTFSKSDVFDVHVDYETQS